MRNSVITPIAAVMFVLGTSMSAHAATYPFTFNYAATGPSLTSGNNNTQIANYFNAVLGAGAVTVSAGAVVDSGYNGDGHVVGTTTDSRSTTLGTSDNVTGMGVTAARSGVNCTVSGCTGALDNFIRNVNGTPSWDFTFNNGIVIDSVSFDYEIFPDGTCTAAPCGTNLPDMTVTAGVTQLFHYVAVTPATTLLSPNSPLSSQNETAPQLIGTYAYVGSSLNATKLTFSDWPAMIGIDNLNLTYHNNGTSAVPEPTSMLLLGSGLVGLYSRRKKRNA
jgi:hypothetical protein